MHTQPRNTAPEPNGSCEQHLVVNELGLPPGGEWSPQFTGWLVIHVTSGEGYWLHPRLNFELQTGAVVLLSDKIHACVRASQVGELRLHACRIDPGKLPGLVSMAEQTLMRNAAGDEKLSLRVLAPSTRFSDKFRELGSDKSRNTFPARVHLLQLFLELFGGDFQQLPADANGVFDTRERLKQMLDQTPASALLKLSFPELVSKTGCSPRHVSRLFTELVGVSFRETQTALRLKRACELLATTDSKVVDVAMESGYQSTSLFSSMFKQRFGTGPAKWRERAQRRSPALRALKRVRLMA